MAIAAKDIGLVFPTTVVDYESAGVVAIVNASGCV